MSLNHKLNHSKNTRSALSKLTKLIKECYFQLFLNGYINFYPSLYWSTFIENLLLVNIDDNAFLLLFSINVFRDHKSSVDIFKTDLFTDI